MQINCKWASCRSQFMTQSDCSHSSSHSSAPQWLKTIVTCTVHSLVKRSLVISTAFFFPLPFFLLSSVTQMLTTQADRFSAEEVHCSPPAHANYHHYNSFVSVGELNWKKNNTRMNVIMTTTCVHVRHIFMQKKNKPWVNHLNTLFMHTGLWAVWGITSDKSGVNVSLSVA